MKKKIKGNEKKTKKEVSCFFKEYGFEIISLEVILTDILKENHIKIAKMFSMPPQKFSTFKTRLFNMITNKQVTLVNYKKELKKFLLPLIIKEIMKTIDNYKILDNKYIIVLSGIYKRKVLKKMKKLYKIIYINKKSELVVLEKY